MKLIIDRLLLEENEARLTNKSLYGIKEHIIALYKPSHPWLDHHHIDYYKHKHHIPTTVTLQSNDVSSLTEPAEQVEASTETDDTQTINEMESLNDVETVSERKKGERSKGSTNENKMSLRMRVKDALSWCSLKAHEMRVTLNKKAVPHKMYDALIEQAKEIFHLPQEVTLKKGTIHS